MKRPAAGRTAHGSKGEQLGSRLDLNNVELRRGPQAISSPREAVQAMINAGAVFSVQRRGDVLGMSFTYAITPGGDRDRARAILAEVKARPPAFLAALKSFVQAAAGPIE